MYLNEQCKDAMNFSDFINGIEVSHEDLENNAQLGFVGGVSKILIDNLKMMNRNERPIHCTDVKRETMYIKDDNKWTKEENDSKLRSAIQEITRKSISINGVEARKSRIR
jgi:benzoyl-CoA reductase/2-hydroxyglutaryl-CoA dehydratase subunit BcrC/BadD/HgdB